MSLALSLFALSIHSVELCILDWWLCKWPQRPMTAAPSYIRNTSIQTSRTEKINKQITWKLRGRERERKRKRERKREKISQQFQSAINFNIIYYGIRHWKTYRPKKASQQHTICILSILLLFVFTGYNSIVGGTIERERERERRMCMCVAHVLWMYGPEQSSALHIEYTQPYTYLSKAALRKQIASSNKNLWNFRN